MEKTISKHTEQGKALSNHYCWKGLLAIFLICGTQTKNTFSFSLRNQILITLQSSSPMKSPKMKQHSWTQQSITERMKAFLMRAHISNQLKPFSALTSTAVTHQALKKGFFKGQALTLLRTNSSRATFTDNIKTFKTCLISRGYPKKLVEKILSEGNYADRKTALTQKQNAQKAFTLCDPILTIITTFGKHTNGQMAFNTRKTITQRDIQGASLAKFL